MKWAVGGRRFPGYGWKFCCAALLLILFLLTWYLQARHIPFLLMQQEQQLRSTLDLAVMNTTEVLVVRPGHTLDRGIRLTGEHREAFQLLHVPEMFLPDAYLTTHDELLERNLATTLVGGQIVTPEALLQPWQRLDGPYRLVQLPIRDFMLDVLAPGTLIDLLADDGLGNYRVLATKIPVHATGFGEGQSPRILVPLDDEEQRRIWAVKENQELLGRLYLNPDQAPSRPDLDGTDKPPESGEGGDGPDADHS